METAYSYTHENATQTEEQNQAAGYETLIESMKAAHFFIEPKFDGVLRRFDRNGHGNAWSVCRMYQLKNKTIFEIKVGDFKFDENHTWRTEDGLSQDQLKEAQKLYQEAEKENEEKKQKERENVAKNCEAIWHKAILTGDTPYLKRKELSKLYGARMELHSPTTLLVPLRDVDGKLWNIQRILPEKLPNYTTDKLFFGGGRIKGLFHQMGFLIPNGHIIICEGFATGASIHEASGHCTLVVFMASNLFRVCREIRAKYPQAIITVCGDEDKWTKRPDGGLWNAGREKATYAASTINVRVIFPLFKNLDTKPTDFNDLHKLEGLEVVKEQIQDGLNKKVLLPICEFTKNGVPKKASEYKIVKTLVEFFEGSLIRQEEELFKFENTHWQHQDDENVRKIKQMLDFVSGHRLNNNEIERAYKHFLLETLISPKNMFQPNPFYANFLNGTLVISKKPGELSYDRAFKEHNRNDYITNVIPLEYEPERKETNLEFALAVDMAFKDDVDKVEKIKALKEMFGACLTPAFPRIFLLLGPPGSGKSTFTILASKLVSDENLSMVEPHEFRGFLMESMIGKLVNCSTDINTTQAIDAAMMKKIEDRVPVRIDRKFKPAVKSWLPAVHIWGCNELPPNYVGRHGAFTRRTTILEFKSFKAQGNFNKNFANDVFNLNPQGVLNFALEGLEALCEQGGHFTNPGSGAEALHEWQIEKDVVGLFFQDLFDGEIDGQTKLEAGAEYTIPRPKLCVNFKSWQDENVKVSERIGKKEFLKRAIPKYCQANKDSAGIFQCSGFRVGEGAGSLF